MGVPARAEVSPPRAALTQYKIDTWQTEQGLPLNTVQALLQTRDGYLWVGTAGGLARFDGVRFAGVDPVAAADLAANPVFGLMEDAQGRLWVGHNRGATIHLNGRYQLAFSSEVTASKRVWAFAQAPDGAVWAATENGLVRWDKGQVRHYQQADGLPTNRLRALVFDRDGVLWIATTGGGLVSMRDGRFQVHEPANGFPHLQVRSVLADVHGGVWAATAGAGLVHIAPGGAQRVYTTKDGLPTDHLTALALDAHGSLWVGSWGGGVSRLSDDRFNTIAMANGLAGDQIWTLQADREGNVWVGTWVGGLNRVRQRAFGVLGTPEGLSHDNTRAVLHTRSGVTWVSTAGAGLNRIEGARITPLGRKEGLPTDETSSLLEDRDGSLWIGTYTAGVARYKDGLIQTWGLAEGLPNAEVRSLHQDRQGTVWAGTRAGLARFDGQGFIAVREPGAPQEGVSVILEDRSGTLWFGTTGAGLVRLRDGRFSTLTKADGLVSDWILALHEDASGSLWIGSNGEGINRLREGRLAAIRTSDGLWDGLAQTLLEDRLGYLWMTCNRGFFRVARAELDAFADGRISRVKSTGFGPGDALRATTFAGGLQPAGAIDAQGKLWLPSANGLAIVDPGALPGTGQPPPVRIENVLIDGKEAPLDAGVVLPPGAVPLAIRYTAMTLVNADRARFRYRMLGLTPGWVDARRSREAAFPALPHGHYRFQVAASTDGERWSESAPLPITVQARFHETPWFLAACMVALVAAVLGLVRLRTHALRTRQIDMERLVAQRTEELRLANEHLSRLSFVDALTGLANRRRFDEALHEEWRRSRRHQTPMAVVIADVDSFKAYNDLLGHPEGDRCLREVASVFPKLAGRAGDLAARYGGEEFVVLLAGTDQAAAMAVAEALRVSCEALALPHPDSPTGPVITLSLGVASALPSEDDTPVDLIARADAALYRAKQGGRNRVSD
jgi:diguanylate cyclase (GGDEF)-like protein